MDEWSLPEPDALPEELAEFVKPELQPGERLLWAAVEQPRPASAIKFPLSSLLLALVSLGVSAASFTGIFGVYRQSFLSVEGLMIGVGIVAAIVGIIAGGVAIEQLSNRGRSLKKTYALTDRRAIIWMPRKDSKAVEVFTMSRGSINAIHRLEYPDGSGDVKFRQPSEEYYYVPGFDCITNVRAVEDLVRRTLIDTDQSFRS
jgi:hypothetical protein